MDSGSSGVCEVSKHPARQCEVVTLPPTKPHPTTRQNAGVRFLGGIGSFLGSPPPAAPPSRSCANLAPRFLDFLPREIKSE